MERERFEKLVEEALKGLPRKFRKLLDNIAVMVEDRPPRGRNLLGIYQGVPLDQRGPSYYGNTTPDVIVIYREPIERISKDEDDMRDKVRSVVLHEIGHYFGMDEAQLEDIEKDLDF